MQSRTLSPTHASLPHRDARDDWCSSLNEPVHLTYSLLAALILEPLLGQLLQCLLELLKGDGPVLVQAAVPGQGGSTLTATHQDCVLSNVLTVQFVLLVGAGAQHRVG